MTVEEAITTMPAMIARFSSKLQNNCISHPQGYQYTTQQILTKIKLGKSKIKNELIEWKKLEEYQGIQS